MTGLAGLFNEFSVLSFSLLQLAADRAAVEVTPPLEPGLELELQPGQIRTLLATVAWAA